jgi:hypothetical protein
VVTRGDVVTASATLPADHRPEGAHVNVDVREAEAWRRDRHAHLAREVRRQAAWGWTSAEIARRCAADEREVEAILREVDEEGEAR